MDKKPIALIAAMPEEIRPLLRRIGPWSRQKLNGFSCYRLRIHHRDVILIESGMGMKNAAQAAHHLIVAVRPHLILNFGFGGAISADIEVGDVVIAGRILLRHDRLFAEESVPPAQLVSRAVNLLQETEGAAFQTVNGTVITTPGITSKGQLAKQLPQQVFFPVVDMETAAIARVARKEGVQLLGIRAVSDDSGEELDFSIEEFCDSHMKIRLHKVLLTVARKPRIIPQLLRLARNSKIAGENLATALLVMLSSLTTTE